MILSLLIIILIGLIAFFHYTQGLWSATLSAICAVVAALLAVSFHESVANLLVGIKMQDQAHSIAIVLLFTVIYTILRVIFDKFIPGNIRVPAILDKVGGAVMGVIAGIFATGILAIAAQALPVGPAALGYARYELAGAREVAVPSQRAGGQQVDTFVYNELSENAFLPDKRESMLAPVDNALVGLVARQSSGGALAGGRPLEAVHPDYLDELFFNRLGVELGGRRTAVNTEGDEQVTVESLHRLRALPAQADGEISQVRSAPVTWPEKANEGQMFLVVRTRFTPDAADVKDKTVRLSPATARLVTKDAETGGMKNHTPIGTLENGNFLLANKPDDFLFVDPGKGPVDLVYLVEEREVLAGGDEPKIAPGVFLEVKRMARVDLSNQAVKEGPTPGKTGVIRKQQVLQAAKVPAAPAGGATPAAKPTAGTPAAGAGASSAGTPGAAAAEMPIAVRQLSSDARLFSAVNVGTGEANVNNAQIASGTVSLKEGKLSKFEIDPTQTLALLRQGANAVDGLYIPAGSKLVQVAATPTGGEPWAWADAVTDFEVKDASGKAYKPNGAFARVKAENSERMVAAYDSAAPISGVGSKEGQPTEVYLAFVVPAAAEVKELSFKGKPGHQF